MPLQQRGRRAHALHSHLGAVHLGSGSAYHRLRSRKAVLCLALVVVCVALGIVLAGSPTRRSATVERARIWYDSVTCTAVQTADVPHKIDLGREDCNALRGTADPFLSIPRIYIAEAEVAAAMATYGCTSSCGATLEPFYAWIAENRTGTVVTSPAAADVVVIPYPQTCAGCQRDTRGSFETVWQAVRHLHSRFATLCIRPWMERTHFGMESREFFRRYPQVTLWSPEIKNVRLKELQDTLPRFSQHIVVPQAPLEVLVYDAPQRRDWPRPYTFCFQGTILNEQRATLARVLGRRSDSYVRAMCRRDRETTHAAMAPSSSAEVYAQCKFCPMPMGDSLSDTRFFDAMRTGCLPIIFERLRPLPFAHWLDYFSWSLLQTRHDEAALTAAFERLARMPEHERIQRRASMLDTARQLSFSRCQGRPGLTYALAALNLPMEARVEDSLGHTHEVG